MFWKLTSPVLRGVVYSNVDSLHFSMKAYAMAVLLTKKSAIAHEFILSIPGW